MTENPFDYPLFSELYDVQPQAIIWLSPIFEDSSEPVDFAYTYCNEEGLNYLGISRDQQQGMTVSNTVLLPEDLKAIILDEMIGVYKTGQKSITSLYNPVLNKYVKVLRTKLRNGVLSVVQDVTTEQKALTQLQEQKALLDNLLQNSPAGISITEVIRNEKGNVIDARTVMANERAASFVGLPRDIFLSKTALELDPDVLKSQYGELYLKTLNTGEPSVLQYFLEYTGRWLELNISRMDENRVIHVFTDVTPIKEAQLYLERSAEKLQTIINTSPTGFVMGEPVMDEKGEISDFQFTMVNNVISRFTGKSPEELIGEKGSRWFARYKTNGLFERLRDAYLTGEKQQFDFYYDGDRDQVWVNILIVRIKDEMLCSVTDFTREKKLQMDLQALVGELQRSNASLEEFAYAASHDMKEPVRKVQYFMERLKFSIKDRLKADEERMFERVESANDRMRLLIEDLLEYSHVSMKPKEKEEIDLNQKLKNVLSDLELPIREKGAVVMLDTLPTIRGHRRQIGQVFQNLIGNSLKYTREGVRPEIRITTKIVIPKDEGIDKVPSARECDSFHLIRISDNGIGFDQSYSERIFAMFTRLHGVSEYKGTGVGLSIVKKVVENHHGIIWAEGEEGKGATFNILFPV